MRFALAPHPDTPSSAVASIEVEVARSPSKLALTYAVTGNVAGVRWPPAAAPALADGLWRHTCFELFARVPRQDGYVEYNFSPSTQWAFYGFRTYRESMDAHISAPPQIRTTPGPRMFTLNADVNTPFLPFNPALQIGLSAVIEEINGAKSYWALAHAPGKPDFHHADAFAATLEPT